MNNELDKKQSEENNAVMTDIVCYLRVSNISEHDQEVVRHDLLEMVLSAQERNEDIRTVFGEDYKSFCDEIIAVFPQKNKKAKILDCIDMIISCTAIIGAIDIIISKETIELIITSYRTTFKVCHSCYGWRSIVIYNHPCVSFSNCPIYL